MRCVLFLFLLVFSADTAAQVRQEAAYSRLENIKSLIQALYPSLKGDLYATYTEQDEDFSSHIVPLTVFVAVEKYCYAEMDPKTRAVPVDPRHPCSFYHKDYQAELSMRLDFSLQDGHIRLRQFTAGGTMFSPLPGQQPDLATKPKFGPDKRAEVIAAIPIEALQRALETSLEIGKATFDPVMKQWTVLLEGPQIRYVLIIEQLNGRATMLTSLPNTSISKSNQ